MDFAFPFCENFTLIKRNFILPILAPDFSGSTCSLNFPFYNFTLWISCLFFFPTNLKLHRTKDNCVCCCFFKTFLWTKIWIFLKFVSIAFVLGSYAACFGQFQIIWQQIGFSLLCELTKTRLINSSRINSIIFHQYSSHAHHLVGLTTTLQACVCFHCFSGLFNCLQGKWLHHVCSSLTERCVWRVCCLLTVN